MTTLDSLAGRTLFITGASRGIGKAIALRAAQDGANIVIAAKTSTPHPKLEGTIHTAAAELEAAGGQALPVVVDVRDEASIQAAVDAAVARFGGIDILVNNASAIALTNTLGTSSKRYDLMHQVNSRGTWLTSKLCLPQLLKSDHAHILNISPPLNMDPRWFGPHVAYTMAKYGMSMSVLGMAEEFQGKVGVNALWPRTTIATAAVANMPGGELLVQMSRRPAIMADAAHVMLRQDPRTSTGRFAIDDAVLADAGVTDFAPYAVTPGGELAPDFFL